MEIVMLLSSNDDTRQVEEEEKSRFVRSVLESMGLDVADIWDEHGHVSLENKVKFRQLLSAYEIQIVDRRGGDLQIYHTDNGEESLIGLWKKPGYTLKKDPHERDPRKRLFLEMKIESWSLFDAEPDDSVYETGDNN